MITYGNFALKDSTDVLLEIEHDIEEQCIRMQTIGGCAFTIPIEEWDEFISKLQTIKTLLLEN